MKKFEIHTDYNSILYNGYRLKIESDGCISCMGYRFYTIEKAIDWCDIKVKTINANVLFHKDSMEINGFDLLVDFGTNKIEVFKQDKLANRFDHFNDAVKYCLEH